MAKIKAKEMVELEEAIQHAKLVAWDGCHKIYLAMDDEQADWFRKHYPHIQRGFAQNLLDGVLGWYASSCGLRFIQSVTTNEQNPNAGFKNIVPQR